MKADKPLHLLVVDKDCNNRDVVRRALDQIGVECTTYSNNNESVAAFKCGDYDGVILDGEPDTYQMFITAARAFNKQDIPIILFSGSTRISKYKELMERGYYVLQQDSKLPNSLKTFVELIKSRQQQNQTQGKINANGYVNTQCNI